MIEHRNHTEKEIRSFIRNGEIHWAGNIAGKIYGSLDCASGKRMMKKNRIFFKTEAEAIRSGFRPCGHCLRSRYIRWKNKI